MKFNKVHKFGNFDCLEQYYDETFNSIDMFIPHSCNQCTNWQKIAAKIIVIIHIIIYNIVNYTLRVWFIVWDLKNWTNSPNSFYRTTLRVLTHTELHVKKRQATKHKHDYVRQQERPSTWFVGKVWKSEILSK